MVYEYGSILYYKDGVCCLCCDVLLCVQNNSTQLSTATLNTAHHHTTPHTTRHRITSQYSIIVA